MPQIFLLSLIATLYIAANLVSTSSADGMKYRTQSLTRNIPDELMKTPDIIEANGYMVETHKVTTEDGYILSLHRIPHKKGMHNDIFGKKRKQKVVLLTHGLYASSVGWIIGGPKSLPFLLADEGYDVWLWNSRGTLYSREHVNMTMGNPKFWDFSFHEQGYYDLPASINYVLEETGQPDLYLIGHSKGTTVGFILFSTRPEFNKKVRLFVCYAPSVYIKNSKSSLLQALYKNISPRIAKQITDGAKLHAMPDASDIQYVSKLISRFCQQRPTGLDICLRFLFHVNGYNYELLKMEMVPSLFYHFPAGGSLKELAHYLQIAKSDRFAMFDMGKANMKMYGSKIPPKYNLANVVTPVAFYYGDNDLIISKKDVDRDAREIKNVAGIFRVPHDKFNHIDFLFAKTTEDILFKHTLRLMSGY